MAVTKMRIIKLPEEKLSEIGGGSQFDGNSLACTRGCIDNAISSGFAYGRLKFNSNLML